MRLGRWFGVVGVAVGCWVCSAGVGRAAGGSLPEVRRDVWNLVFIGDSITEGDYLGDPERNAPPALCTAELRRRMPGAEIYGSNAGRSGDTTLDFLPGTGKDFGLAEANARALQKAHAGRLLFSIMLGTNDSAETGTNGAPVSAETFEKNLRTIVGRLRSEFPGSVVVLEQPTWYSPNTANRSEYGASGLRRLQSYFPLLPKVAARYRKDVFVGDTRAFDVFRERSKELLRPENGQHGVFYLHPNQGGAKVLAGTWADAIEPHIAGGASKAPGQTR